MSSQPEVRYEDGVTGKQADVYRNLQVGGYNIRSRETETYGTVIGHKESVVVQDVEFAVNEAQRQKVIEEQCKNVHAFVRGTVVDASADTEKHLCKDIKEHSLIPITYNPYEYAHFVHADTKEPVQSAEYVLLTEDGVYAVGIEYKNKDIG